MLPSLMHDDQWFSEEEAKSDLVLQYFNDILGKPFTRSHGLNLHSLGVPQLDLAGIDAPFTEDEVWSAVRELPGDRAPGPDRFTGLFYKMAWPVIKVDIMNAFHALWASDFRSFHLLNDALMVLLRKTASPTLLKDYGPISLMHSFSKLYTKCLA